MKSQMSYIVEQVNKKPYLVACIQAHNEEEFIGLSLEHHYEMFDRIIVIEGAVEARRHVSTPDGHSTDNTVKIIQDFKTNKDSEGKIAFIQIKRFWKNLEELKQTFIDLTNEGDILVICDSDEFYLSEDIQRVRRAFDLEPSMSELIPTFLHFYRDFEHIAVPGPEWNPSHQRILRHPGHGSTYKSHPVLTDPQGHCTYFSPHYQSRRFVPKNPIWIFHYGYARQNMDQIMKSKKEYYEKELAKHASANLKFDEKIRAWFEDTEPVLFYDSKYPKIITKHLRFSNPMIGWRTHSKAAESGLIKNWKDDPFYDKILNKQEVGNIWLCMEKKAQPYMNFYHNGIDI